MMTDTETNRENLLLTDADLAACRPIVDEGGHVLRALCPFHGSDRQRSLRVQVHNGRCVCFACGVWGSMETPRSRLPRRGAAAKAYLQQRSIPIALAQQRGVGYPALGAWAHPARA